MRLVSFASALLLLPALTVPSVASAQSPAPRSNSRAQRTYLGFDSNEYPGDAQLPTLRKQFAFAGYWLTNPPGADHNPWVGKRSVLVRNDFGFLVVANGRLDKEILASQKAGKSAAALGREDAAAVVAAAHREGFPPRTILFLDQEEGGGMLPEQAEYLLAWTEKVNTSAYRAGVYASGQPVPDGKGADGRPKTITTIQDLRAQIAAKHLRPVFFWAAQDACPPAPGCVVHPASPPEIDLNGTPYLTAWQFAQSPRRASITRACGATYNADGNCYAPGSTGFKIDLNTSTSLDPSHGR